MNKQEREEHNSLLERCIRKDKELAATHQEVAELEKQLEGVEAERDRYWITIREQRQDIDRLQREVEAANRRVATAQDLAEEGAIAAGNSSRVAIRLMAHIDEYVHNLRQEKSK